MTIQPSGRSSALVDELRAAILRGDYSPNERLVESTLARDFEASRGAVRIALFELSGEGLVEREANRGARVRAISREEAVGISEVRMALEGLLAAKAACRATSAEADELREVVAAMEAAQSQGNVIACSELNLVLHRRVREIADHPTASSIVDRLRNQSVRIQFRLALVPGRAAASLAEHRAVVEAIVAGDPEAAEQAMRDHLEAVVATVGAMDASGLR